MVIQLKLIGRADPADIATLLPALTEAAARVDVDHTRLAATLEWVQYRKNFRAPVMVRPFQLEPRTPPTATTGRSPRSRSTRGARRTWTAASWSRSSPTACRRRSGSSPTSTSACTSRAGSARARASCGRSTAAYWRHLASWDETFQKDYAAALPGGVSDGTNPEFWGEQVEAFMDSLDRLDAWSELPDEIHVLELGVGDGEQAHVWLETFAAACRERGRDYLEPRALPHGRLLPARPRAGEASASPPTATQVDGDRARLPQPDASAWSTCSGKVLFAHTCNLYDNLPTDEIMRVGDAAYEPLVRASITPDEIKEISAKHDDRAGGDRRADPAHHPQRAGLAARPRARPCSFWADVWDAIHLEEIYVEIPSPSSLRLAPTAEAYLDTLRRRHAGLDARAPLDRRGGELRPDAACSCTTRACSSRRTSSSARLDQYGAVPRSGQARGLDRQLAQRADLPARRRAPRLQGRRRAVRVPRGLEHRRADRAPPRHAPCRARRRASSPTEDADLASAAASHRGRRSAIS